jgi:hypothetical protein
MRQVDNIAAHKIFCLAVGATSSYIDRGRTSPGALPKPPARAGKGGNMALIKPLNMIAVMASFAFLAAIVFGMV